MIFTPAIAALLFVAAQAGFLDGPRVLANMALDRWFPTRFATLSISGGVPVADESFACLDCGLVWTVTDKDKLLGFLESHCYASWKPSA